MTSSINVINVRSAVLFHAHYGAAYGVPITGPIVMAPNPLDATQSTHAVVDTVGLTAAAIVKLPPLSSVPSGSLAFVSHASTVAAFNIAVLPSGSDTLDAGASPAQVLCPSTQATWSADPANGTWRRLDRDRAHTSVLDWGAYGDGAQDDVVAIQAAIDSIRDVGGTVYFPPTNAHYAISTSIKLDAFHSGHAYANIEMRGAGPASWIKRSTPNNDNILPAACFLVLGATSNGLANVGFRHLRCSGYDETTNGSNFGPVIYFGNTTATYVESCTIDTNPREGVYWNNDAANSNARCVGNNFSRIGGYTDNGSFPLSAINPSVADLFCAWNYVTQCGQGVEHTGSGATFIGNVFREIAHAGTAYIAMNISTTSSSSKVVISGNTITNAASGLSISSGGDGIDIANNIFQQVTQPIAVTANGAVHIHDNTFYDALAASNAAIVRGTFGSNPKPALIESNRFIVGPTSPWGYLIRIADDSIADIVRGNVSYGVTWTTYAFWSNDANANVEWIDNIIQSGNSNQYVRYQWRGTPFAVSSGAGGVVSLAGLDTQVTLSTKRPSSVRHAAPPTGGIWSVGDRIENTTSAASGNMGWVCVAAGTPGSWKSWGSISS